MAPIRTHRGHVSPDNTAAPRDRRAVPPSDEPGASAERHRTGSARPHAPQVPRARRRRGARRHAVGDRRRRRLRSPDGVEHRRPAPPPRDRRARRTARSTTTSASRRRCRRAATGRLPGTRSPTRTAAARAVRAADADAGRSAAPVGRRAPAVERRPDGRLLRDRAGTHNHDGDQSMVYYTARQLPFYYSLFDDSGLCANYFCSVLGRHAPEPLLPDVRDVRRAHHQRPLGLRRVRLEALADHPRPARGRRRQLEDLLHRLRRRHEGRQRQRRRLLDALRARPAHHRHEATTT